MEKIGSCVICAVTALIVLTGFIKSLPVFDLFIEGAKSGAIAAKKLMPTLVGLIVAITMLRESGFLDMITAAIEPILSGTGIDSELLPLILLRPLSGSGSISYVTELYSTYGGDAEISKLAAIMASSTETTFYAAAVYFGGRGYESIRYTIPAALCGDAATVILAIASIKLLG